MPYPEGWFCHHFFDVTAPNVVTKARSLIQGSVVRGQAWEVEVIAHRVEQEEGAFYGAFSSAKLASPAWIRRLTI
jgi:hypothetical protein